MSTIAQQSRLTKAHRSTSLGLLAAGCVGAGAPLFAQIGGSPLAHHPASPGSSWVARNTAGSTADGEVSSPGSSGVAAIAGAAGALAAAAVATSGLTAARRTGAPACRTAAAAAAASKAQAEAPPPPPPFDPSAQVGALAPLGFFDPLGFAKTGDEAGFRTLREAELKHGRVAMVAAVGLLFQHFVKIPTFEQVPSGVWALTTQQGALGFLAIVISSGVFELSWRTDPESEGGTFSAPLSSATLYTEDLRNKELSNGRFAMISVLGILAAELVTGRDAVQQLGF